MVSYFCLLSVVNLKPRRVLNIDLLFFLFYFQFNPLLCLCHRPSSACYAVTPRLFPSRYEDLFGWLSIMTPLPSTTWYSRARLGPYYSMHTAGLGHGPGCACVTNNLLACLFALSSFYRYPLGGPLACHQSSLGPQCSQAASHGWAVVSSDRFRVIDRFTQGVCAFRLSVADKKENRERRNEGEEKDVVTAFSSEWSGIAGRRDGRTYTTLEYLSTYVP